MIIPSMPLSSRVQALIFFPDCFPTKVTLRVIEGDHIVCMVPLGAGSESRVSNRAPFHM